MVRARSGHGSGGSSASTQPIPPSEAPSAIPQRGGRTASRTAGGNQGSKPIRGVFIPFRRLGCYIGCRSIGRAPVSNPPGFGTRRARRAQHELSLTEGARIMLSAGPGRRAEVPTAADFGASFPKLRAPSGGELNRSRSYWVIDGREGSWLDRKASSS